jgi:thiol:disulfide interchange protein
MQRRLTMADKMLYTVEKMKNPLFQNVKIDPEILKKIFDLICHPKWLTNYNDALNNAKTYNMRVLAAFTGYKWCGYCKALESEVFGTCAFGLWLIGKGLVLLNIDLAAPPWSTPPPPDQQALLTKYKVAGFPTVIGLNADGSERGRVTGYSSGSGVPSWTQKFETNAQLNTTSP